jgi:hypothetical protein
MIILGTLLMMLYHSHGAKSDDRKTLLMRHSSSQATKRKCRLYVDRTLRLTIK